MVKTIKVRRFKMNAVPKPLGYIIKRGYIIPKFKKHPFKWFKHYLFGVKKLAPKLWAKLIINDKTQE